ncbi:Uncharacterised protein [Mycobacteroides abscessus subsp. abscessus]|nr:Uncharacterised protein [Mycobacteroides abscessus subsp. abscessus]
MGRWHPNIDDDEVRALRSNQFQQRRGIPRATYHLEAGLFQNTRHALP